MATALGRQLGGGNALASFGIAPASASPGEVGVDAPESDDARDLRAAIAAPVGGRYDVAHTREGRECTSSR